MAFAGARTTGTYVVVLAMRKYHVRFGWVNDMKIVFKALSGTQVFQLLLKIVQPFELQPVMGSNDTNL